MKAHYDVLNDLEKEIPDLIQTELMFIIAELTHPIPEERGNPARFRAKGHQQYSLERYISVVDRLAKTITYYNYDRK